METAIYCRVSTEEQATEGFSIRGQVEKLKSYVSAKSWAVYDVYLDEGISGKNITERPAINRMIDDIKAGRVKNVLVFKLDRLTRSVADLVQLIDLFKKYDCAFNSLTESIDTSTASGRMFIKIIGIFAEFERENIGERVRLGRERKAKEGFTTACNFTSYGYDREKGEKVQRINKTESEVVKRIFDLYVNQNMTLNGIARLLNTEKIPTKQNNTWSTNTILMVLKNCNYIGNVRYGMVTPERYFEVEGKHKAIISADIFNKAQMLLDKNKKATPTKRNLERNYFVGVVYCSLCGTKASPHTTNNNNKIQYNFACGKRGAGACTSKMVTAGKIEKALIKYINEIPETIPDTAKDEKEKARAAARVAELEKKLTALDVRDKEFLDLYVIGESKLDEYRSVKKVIDSERAEILAEVEILTPTEITHIIEPKTQSEIVSYFKDNWSTLNDTEKRQFLLNHVNKIFVVNHPQKNTHTGKCEITSIEFNTQ